MTYENANDRRPARYSDKPRRVRGGVRLRAAEWPPMFDWGAARWLSAVTSAAGEELMREGFVYATTGQTRALEIAPGRISGPVQGREPRAYRTIIEIEMLTPRQWDSVLSSMGDQAIHTAKLLAGELPPGIEDAFSAVGLALFPNPDQLTTRCTCSARPSAPPHVPPSHVSALGATAMRTSSAAQAHAPTDPALVGATPHIGPGERATSGWCKHACCLALLFADLIENDPFAIFTARGMRAGDLLEHLRNARAVVGGRSGPQPAQGVPAEVLVESAPLSECIANFWDAGPSLDTLETPLRPPEVSHALLRRLGPSPFTDSRFPLMGLLATCYDTISEAALRSATNPPDEPAP